MNSFLLHRAACGMITTVTKLSRTTYIGYARSKADMTHEKELVNVRLNDFRDRLSDIVKRFEDVGSIFGNTLGKRLDDVGNTFGKRLDDFASRMLSHERTHLFLFGTVVGLFEVTFKLFGDLNDKFDNKFDNLSKDLNDKFDNKFDNLSKDLNDKFDNKFDKISKEMMNLSKEIHALASNIEQRNSHTN
jgi:uncharacterized protein YukE